AAGEQRQGRQAQPPLEKQAALQVRHVGLAQPDVLQFRFDRHDASPWACAATAERRALPVIIGSSTLGTSSVSATWTMRNKAMPAMPKKCRSRGPSKPPSGTLISSNWTGFQSTSPDHTIRIIASTAKT